MKSKTTLRNFLAIAGSSLLVISSAHATTLTWDNGASTGSWNTTDLNWTGAAAWNNGTPDDAVFVLRMSADHQPRPSQTIARMSQR